jgi:hypothetical protein
LGMPDPAVLVRPDREAGSQQAPEAGFRLDLEAVSRPDPEGGFRRAPEAVSRPDPEVVSQQDPEGGFRRAPEEGFQLDPEEVFRQDPAADCQTVLIRGAGSLPRVTDCNFLRSATAAPPRATRALEGRLPCRPPSRHVPLCPQLGSRRRRRAVCSRGRLPPSQAPQSRRRQFRYKKLHLRADSAAPGASEQEHLWINKQRGLGSSTMAAK